MENPTSLGYYRITNHADAMHDCSVASVFTFEN